MKRIFLILLFASLVYSESGNWGFKGSYEYFPVSARILSLAKSGSALTEDMSSVYFNPACLAYINPQQIVFSDALLPLGSTMGWFGYARPTKDFGNFGIHITGLYAGKMEITDIWGNKLHDKYADFNISTSLSYARELTYNVGFGFSYKLIYHTISEYSGIGHGLDIGFLFSGNNPFSFGFSVYNLLPPRIKLIEETERFPLGIKGGFVYRIYYDKFLILFDLTGVPEYNIIEPSAGLEYKPFKFLSIRSGMDDKRFCFGFGVEYPMIGKTIGVDFAGTYHYSSGGVFPMIYYFTLFLHFAGFRLEVTPSTYVFSPTSRENNVLPIRIFVNTKKEIERYQFLVKDSKGEVIRVYKDYGAPPREIIWDGRDDFGSLAMDGRYYYECIVVENKGSVFREEGFLSEIRTIGPAGEIFFKEKIKRKEEVPEEKKEKIIIEEKEKETPEEKAPEGGGK
uniref:PorV/PorQ family protein n=2 Tax=candidate division WOR-3 bacterium TaxID=2052148 RepID=A0A7V3ZT07_UNCW3